MYVIFFNLVMTSHDYDLVSYYYFYKKKIVEGLTPKTNDVKAKIEF